ncbi:DUF4082 domain-containing protein [Actinokineospora globicatena]|uniref:DUF4082 domain-containing protein n=1 Tax=Actinokineospora globicatena TaxID=103729 RepID=A0A9W6QU71_9PSEU|nr:DUF4082 domain-containing protein [Actinokineospora globicatena]GLW94657.1 hypothetical protein Aglo03_54730 [Actinokineospora globicatena]
MRRLVVLVLSVLLIGSTLTAGTAAAASPTARVDLPADNALVQFDQPVTLRGHSTGVAESGVKYTEISLHDQNHFIVIAGAGQNDWEYTFTPGAPRIGPLTVYARVVLDNWQTATVEVLHLRVADAQPGPGTCPCTFNPARENEPTLYRGGGALELGLRFFVDRPGSVNAVSLPSGLGAWTNAITVSLWTDKGTLLARGTQHDEAFTFPLESPVRLEPYAAYVVSFTTPDGVYYATPGFFTKRYTTGAITAHYDHYEPFPFSSPGLYGSPGTFPRSTYNGTSYWVSPVFVT